ncbi:MAG: pentapeptide repeat-containing protein [Xenococcaceae cyanobacterium MO_188.B29]|nr:pentapeptide repeat-containing protein [Xenococcaceae cyanobacterium MO_188.B29]
MKKSTNSKLVKWLKNPDPDTILLKLWKKKRARDKKLQEIEAKQQAKEYKQRIEKEAYLLWEADGKPEGKDDYYWKLAEDKIKGKDLPVIYQPYYLLEKRVLEPTDAWISRQAFFAILGRLGNLALIAAVVAFIFGENVRRNNEVFSAWQTITSANGQPGSGGRIEALQFLNSRPWRFPWIGWTKKGLYWDERENECKLKRLLGLRWERQPLAGLSAPKAYLRNIHLCDASLGRANLRDASLGFANLQNAFLDSANLQNAILWSANLQGANLGRANLQNANLRFANLQDASLGRANLQDAKLEPANLQNANLGSANLQGADLGRANLQNANLGSANLQGADLWSAKNLTHQQIKSACNWDKAIYKSKWNFNLEKGLVRETIEPDNTNFIEELKKDKTSDPKNPPHCRRWAKQNTQIRQFEPKSILF